MKCKRLSAAILSLVMIISLLPTTALAAEKNNVWSTAYDEIRVYMDDATKADHDNLEGILPKQVRLYTSKALLGEYVFCTPGGSYWEYNNRLYLPKHKVTARDITSINLVRDEATGHSPTISIPIEGNTKYKVTVSQEHQKGNIILGIEVGSYDYLCIDITKREHHTVTYKFSDPAPENVSVPEDTATYTETSPVTLLDPDKTSVTGMHEGRTGLWTFNGWTLPDGVDFTDDTHTKFTMPDTNVTVTGTWTFTPTTFVYVYFRTVDSAGNDIDNVEGVTYNDDKTDLPRHWATLGKLETKTSVTDNVYEALGNEVVAQTGFEYYNTANNSFPLDLITWEKVSTHNGAQDYVSPGTEAWHLDGKVYGYRAIYCDSDGKELKGFDPNKTPKYYLEGTDDVALTSKVPDVPGKVFDGWDTTSPDVTVADDNTFNMPGHDVTFTAKWKPGALKIEKILDDKSPAAGNTFSFTVTPGNKTVEITGKGSETISDLPVGDYTVAEDANTAAVSNYTCKTQYRTDSSTWQDTPITVSVASNSTVTVYVKNSYTPITADLIDNAITIYHKVSGQSDWHGEDIGANMTYNYTDTNADTVPKAADAKISYQATLDMKNLDFGVNPEHADTVFKIKKLMQDAGTTSLWEFMEGKNITTFAGSKVNLHVKFDENLNVAKGSFDNIKLTSDWFQLADGYQNGLTKDSNGYWTIPCVIKAEKGTNNSPIINLSGITLSLTDKAQGKLNSNTALDITSEGYIDGTIKISTKILNEIITYELSLIGKSASDTVKNTAKLNLQTYTVTYDANGGSGTMTDKKSPYAYGAAATVLTNGFTRSRYTFTGWNTKADGSGDSYAEGDPIEMLGNVVLYAQWTRNSSHDNDDDKYFFAIQKVDAQDGHALNDAKFELYQRDNRGNKLAAFRKTTSHWGPESGIALFSVSATKTNEGGDTWYYREITAPEGYVLDTKEYEISATDFYHDD